jgi:hypothetical protein
MKSVRINKWESSAYGREGQRKLATEYPNLDYINRAKHKYLKTIQQ